MEKIEYSLFGLFQEQHRTFISIWNDRTLMKKLNIEKKMQLKRLIVDMGLQSFNEKYNNAKETD